MSICTPSGMEGGTLLGSHSHVDVHMLTSRGRGVGDLPSLLLTEVQPTSLVGRKYIYLEDFQALDQCVASPPWTYWPRKTKSTRDISQQKNCTHTTQNIEPHY